MPATIGSASCEKCGGQAKVKTYPTNELEELSDYPKLSPHKTQFVTITRCVKCGHRVVAPAT